MSIQARFQAAVQTLADLAAPSNPGYIAVHAASKLVDLLSPANPYHRDIMNLLEQPDAATGADADRDATDEDEPSAHEEEDEPP